MNNFPFHPTTKAKLESIVRSPGQGYLFSGSQGVGKFAATQLIAQHIFGLEQESDDIGAFQHPNYVVVSLDEGKKNISIGQVHSIIETINLSKYDATQPRIVVFQHADTLSIPAANALLKSLEDTPENTIFFLLSENTAQILPTLRSRLEMVYFALPSAEAVQAYLIAKAAIQPQSAAQVTTEAHGLPGAALVALKQSQELDTTKVLAIANEFNKAGLSQKFLLAKSISAEQKTDSFLKELIFAITAESTILESSSQLESILLAQKQLQNNVNPRLVLENLSLRMGE